MHSYIVRKLGSRRGIPRVYLDVEAMLAAGFAPGATYERSIDRKTKRLTLTASAHGDFVVSKKDKAGRCQSVIDINSYEALGMFAGLEAVRIVFDDQRIHILPIASEAKRVERLERLRANLDAGAIKTAGASFGGGILDHAAHTGLADAGVASRLAIANEIDEPLLGHAAEHNDAWRKETIAVAAPMQELVQDEEAMRQLPTVDLFCCGIPCSGASKAGKAKRGHALMEDHPEVGHLAASALMLINRLNPAVVAIENVREYANSASAQIIRHHLRDCGYVTHELTLSGQEFGAMENRLRWVLVAATKGLELYLDDLAPVVRPTRTMGSLLDDIAPDSSEWRTFDYLKSKLGRDQEKGNGFAMQILSADSTSCPTLRKGYYKGGSTDPLLAHPSDPTLLRQLTVTEHARIKGVPEHLVATLGKVDGHALLGQSIAYAPFRALFARIGRCLQDWRSKSSPVIDLAHSSSPLLRCVG